jgi:hypothetical protein
MQRDRRAEIARAIFVSFSKTLDELAWVPQSDLLPGRFFFFIGLAEVLDASKEFTDPSRKWPREDKRKIAQALSRYKLTL